MAQEWCVSYGILDEETARKLYEKICKRKGKAPEIKSPVKSTTSSSSKSGSKTTNSTKSSTAASSKATGKKNKVIIEDDGPVDTGTF